MNSKRVFFVMIAVVVLLGVGMIAAVVVGNGLLKKRAQTLISLKLDNRSLDEQQTALTQARKDIAKYSSLNQIVKSIVPQDKDQAEAVREVVKIADDSGIKLASIGFGASTLGQIIKPTADSSSGTSSGTTAPPKVTSPVTQALPVDGIPGVYSMAITIQPDSTSPVTYSQFIDFLSRLEQNRRTAQVTTVSAQPTTQDRNKLTFSLGLNLYIKP